MPPPDHRHASVLPFCGPPSSAPCSPAAGPLSSLLSCSSSFLRRCYLLCVPASGAAAAGVWSSLLPPVLVSLHRAPPPPLLIYTNLLTSLVTGLLSRDPYRPYPCIPTETDAENILCVGFGKEMMGMR
ncbi:hypothetical protein Syun_016556 [Stephania yunnanensis]|uniref:Uncharacterized protein n=1 Tax=Stephania yunnanensis TaxID=152371 RepID=A0AAP0J5G6_9MAGN